MRSTQDAVASLDAFAADARFAQMSATLSGLAADLRDGRPSRWRGVDLLGVADPDAVEVEATPRGRRLDLELVRNVLLFFPLLITWMGILFAIHAYRSLLGSPDATRTEFVGAPFLRLWTNGFGGRTWVTLDVVALADGVTILVAVAVAILATVRSRAEETRDEHERRRAVVELRGVLVDASRHVAESGDVDQARIGENLAALLPRYETTLAQLVEAQERLGETLDEGRAHAGEFATAAGALAAAGSETAMAASGLRGEVLGMRQETGELRDTLSALTQGAQELSGGLPQARDGVRELVETVDGVATRFGESIARYETSLASLTAAQETLSTAIGEHRAKVGHLAVATGTIAATSRELVSSSEKLSDGVRDMGDEADQLRETLAGVSTGTDALSTQLGLASAEFRGLIDAVGGVGGTMGELYIQQKTITEALSAVADTPTGTALAAQRTAAAARAAEEKFTQVLAAFPGQLDTVRDGLVRAVERDFEQRREAFVQLGDAGSSALQTVQVAERSMTDRLERSTRAGADLESAMDQAVARLETVATTVATGLTDAVDALGGRLDATLAGSAERSAQRLSQASEDASATVAEAVHRLRETPRAVLPDFEAASAALAESLTTSRRMAEDLGRVAQALAATRPWPRFGWGRRPGAGPHG